MRRWEHADVIIVPAIQAVMPWIAETNLQQHLVIKIHTAIDNIQKEYPHSITGVS